MEKSHQNETKNRPLAELGRWTPPGGQRGKRNEHCVTIYSIYCLVFVASDYGSGGGGLAVIPGGNTCGMKIGIRDRLTYFLPLSLYDNIIFLNIVYANILYEN